MTASTDGGLHDPPTLRPAHRALGPLIRRGLRLSVYGASQVPAAGGVLLAANHLSFLDHFILGAASPRPMRFLGKEELAHGVTGFVNVRIGGMIAVQRGRADAQAIATVVDLLRTGSVVGVFPEGTRSPTGQLFSFRSGLARIAAAAEVPTVPVGLVGTAEVWPLGAAAPRHRPPRGVLSVRFGSVVGPPEATPRARRAFTAEVHDQVAALGGQEVVSGFAPIRDEGTKEAGSDRHQ